MGTATISVDEFQALEQKVLQTVDLIKKEREARAAAEAQCSVLASERDAAQAAANELREQLAAAGAKLQNAGTLQSELESLQREREVVKQRVEKMLAQMDELL